mmetsp:Transcript_14324/g.22215  ORF Transcript_14324/g.22215 Transcript_14324/m.22215 type:complete len:123 (-) Transcript_14324:228-596(-)
MYGFLVFSGLSGGSELLANAASGDVLGALAKEFSNPLTMAAGWSHYLAFDLFVGRWVWIDGLRNRVFTSHSVFLCLMFGPLGLLSHLATRALSTGGKAKDVLSEGLADSMSDENLLKLVEDP